MTEHTVESFLGLTVELEKRKQIRVLHVDDEPDLLKVIDQCLKMRGQFLVDGVQSVEEAFERLQTTKYDVIVSDYQMPQKDGLKFLKELRKGGNKIPFIMFKGKGKEEVAIEALNLGASQYLNKAGDPETVYGQLAHSIKEAVRITEAETKLRDSEEKFRKIFESANDYIICLDTSGRILDVNKNTLKAFTGSKEEIVGKRFTDLDIFPSDMNTFWQMFTKVSKGNMGSDAVVEVCVRNKKGQHVWLECSQSLIKSDDKVTGVLVIARDITDRTRAQEGFSESQQKFSALFNGNPEATVYTDPDMRILDINPRFTTLFGYSIGDVKGENLNDVVVPPNLMEEARVLDEKTAKGYVYHDTFRMRKDGTLIPVSVSAAPISIQNRLAGYIAIYKDISQRKKAEKDLQTALKRLEIMNEKLRVVGGLSRHDVRNKMASIGGYAYLAKKESEGNSKVLEYLGEIETAIQQSARIFDFARAYEMLGAEELAYLDVEKIVDEATALFSDLRRVNIDNDCRGLTVLADSLLRQLFYNLIDNSLKHGQKVTKIRVLYEKTSQEELKLIYEDDGIGIADSDKPKLFKEGYSTGGSTGYGLFLIKKMMEVYGWSVQETGEPCQGARFVVTIPRTNLNGKDNYRVT